MNWFIRLFRRKPKPVPFETPRPQLKAGGDIVARQGGQKRNRVHIYRQPFGYPIRLCDWVYVDVETIERIGETQGICGGAAELDALVLALNWAEDNKMACICKHCQAIAQGKRESIGMKNYGHGKGAA